MLTYSARKASSELPTELLVTMGLGAALVRAAARARMKAVDLRNILRFWSEKAL